MHDSHLKSPVTFVGPMIGTSVDPVNNVYPKCVMCGQVVVFTDQHDCPVMQGVAIALEKAIASAMLSHGAGSKLYHVMRDALLTTLEPMFTEVKKTNALLTEMLEIWKKP